MEVDCPHSSSANNDGDNDLSESMYGMNVDPSTSKEKYLRMLNIGDIVIGKIIYSRQNDFKVKVLTFGNEESCLIDNTNFYVHLEKKISLEDAQVGDFVKGVYCGTRGLSQQPYINFNTELLHQPTDEMLGVIPEELFVPSKSEEERKVEEARNCVIMQNNEITEEYLLLAREYYSNNNIKECLKALKTALFAQPTNIKLLMERAAVYGNLGAFGMARSELYKALNVDNSSEKVQNYFYNIVMVETEELEGVKDYASAARLYAQVLCTSKFKDNFEIQFKFICAVFKHAYSLQISPQVDKSKVTKLDPQNIFKTLLKRHEENQKNAKMEEEKEKFKPCDKYEDSNRDSTPSTEQNQESSDEEYCRYKSLLKETRKKSYQKLDCHCKEFKTRDRYKKNSRRPRSRSAGAHHANGTYFSRSQSRSLSPGARYANGTYYSSSKRSRSQSPGARHANGTYYSRSRRSRSRSPLTHRSSCHHRLSSGSLHSGSRRVRKSVKTLIQDHIWDGIRKGMYDKM